MFEAHAHGLLVFLLSSLVLGKVSSAPHNDLLRGELIQDHDLAQLILVQLLSDLMAVNNVEVEPRLEEQLGIRETVMRRQLPLTQRERKAGCRNFFWKTFTSC
ncbi:somatostatin-1A [Boleophthalmus pectinirostris]|uniref:somatostatin-1A n=1 Tax=Boleophthalmus pectinirostris TaxID=150288 RepID=UPI000A1C5020|nr:somatostatin-1A [Boleophthalmus pectinirostris]